MLAGMYIAYCLVRSHIKPSLGPPLPMEDRAPSALYMAREFVLGMVPLGSLIFATRGSILAGLATPTEAAAVGATGAITLTVAYRQMTYARFRDAAYKTLAMSSMVLFLAVRRISSAPSSRDWAPPP
jgi:TRAP-type mannitol/chloroaromatic compound transport system permease large subunit